MVVMGTGEPLDNYDNLLRFIHILTEDGGIHISQRNLTVIYMWAGSKNL